ncbi:MAG TPA: methyltransferase domain-containing protein [Feifaniaceae bacterium]|nr:methyltransferase domain-containing protein [Feifaniaceae bacterium]
MEWDAQGYAKNFRFVSQYGADLLDLLEVKPGERVLDLGCGDGALTAKLHALGADVTGLDSSMDMLRLAGERHPHLTFLQGDAADFCLPEPVDAVFSNAVFHWILDQHALLNCVANALKPGGRLICEFGGKGNTELIHGAMRRAFTKRGLPYQNTFYFPAVGEYAPLLERHGLRVAYAALFARPTQLQGENGLADWMDMFLPRAFEGLPPSAAEEIRREAVEELAPVLRRDGTWYADYVRIRIKAVKE